MENSEPYVTYWQFIQNACPTLAVDSLSHIASSLQNTYWQEPTSAIDLNNFAVVAQIEAEKAEDLSVQEVYFDLAFEALNNGMTHYGHPLCAAHLALFLIWHDSTDPAIEIAFTTLANVITAAYVKGEKKSPGLAYLPPNAIALSQTEKAILQESLQAEDSYGQSLGLLLVAISRCQQKASLRLNSFSGTEISLQLLRLASQLIPTYIWFKIKLGLDSFKKYRWLGLLYLENATKLALNCSSFLQALYLNYRDFGDIELANFWLDMARNSRAYYPNSPDWRWTELEVDSPLSYICFENKLQLAVEATSRSIATSVLMAEGDWFEQEIEFWRSQIQPGMTVIDVGANIGVYSFSAALRVGAEGMVLAIEPFSGCIRCLKETCRINQISSVKICAGAASDRDGTARLSLSEISELNQVADETDPFMKTGSFEEVPCFTLDSLSDRENLQRLDFLKIDVEGHEMSVLAGSEKTLSQFAPIVIYENIASQQDSKKTVANYLKSKGYRLFRYQAGDRKLIQLYSEEDLQGNLNIIAVPESKIDRIMSSS